MSPVVSISFRASDMLARNVSTLPVRNTPCSACGTRARGTPHQYRAPFPDGSSGPDADARLEAGRVPARVSTTRKFVWEGTRTYLLCSAARVGAPFERTSLFNASASVWPRGSPHLPRARRAPVSRWLAVAGWLPGHSQHGHPPPRQASGEPERLALLIPICVSTKSSFCSHFTSSVGYDLWA